MRHTRSHTGNRRSHHALKEQNISLCPDCGAARMNHTMCVNCGKYKGRIVVDMVAKIAKKEQKMKERNKEIGAQSQQSGVAAK